MTKMNDVTNTDIELLVLSGYDLCSRALDYNRRIGNGQAEHFHQPSRKAQGLLAASRALADLAARILNRATLLEQEQHEKADKAHG